jgi:hypothetical protein
MLIWLSESNLSDGFSEVSLIRDNQGRETVWLSKDLIIKTWKTWLSMIIKTFTTSLPSFPILRSRRFTGPSTSQNKNLMSPCPSTRCTFWTCMTVTNRPGQPGQKKYCSMLKFFFGIVSRQKGTVEDWKCLSEAPNWATAGHSPC